MFSWVAAGIDTHQLSLLFSNLSFIHTVHALGVTLDSKLILSRQVNLHVVAPSCHYQPRQLRVISSALTQDGIVVHVHLFVASRIDYSCSSLVAFPWSSRANSNAQSRDLFGWSDSRLMM